MRFAMVIGVAEIYQIEARAIVKGQKLSWINGYKQIEVNCDNAMLIDTIWNGFVTLSNIPKVRAIHEWCTKDWKVKFRHVLRDSNKVADGLAMMEMERLNQVSIYQDPPQNVICLLEEDNHISLYEGTSILMHF